MTFMDELFHKINANKAAAARNQYRSQIFPLRYINVGMREASNSAFLYQA